MKATYTEKEKKHVRRVKELPCGCCGAAGPSHAHHILQGRTPGRRAPHWLTIPVCEDCHVGTHNGIHRLGRMWAVMKLSEFDVLADTLNKLYGHLK